MIPVELDFRHYLGKRVQLGVSGCVAAYKACELLRMILASRASAGATLTASAQRFVSGLSFKALGADPVYEAMFEPGEEPFAHLSPARAADCLVIAPATANILAKLACGLADDMLSTQALAFDGPLVIAPAMNPRMWRAPAVAENWAKLLKRGAIGVEPEFGRVACGEEGQGRLAGLEDIYSRVLYALSPKDMAGLKVLISLGPTREPFDAARHWSNQSSGRMGASLAVAAWLRGASVRVVAGPCGVWLPRDVECVRVETAKQMYAACLDFWPHCDLGVMSAAVSDFSPVYHGSGKFKKGSLDSASLNIEFTQNPDILAQMGREKKPDQMLAGFCAETSNLAGHAKDKLSRKNLDLIVGNLVGEPGQGFASEVNEVTVLDAKSRLESWPLLAKSEVAWRVFDWLMNL